MKGRRKWWGGVSSIFWCSLIFIMSYVHCSVLYMYMLCSWCMTCTLEREFVDVALLKPAQHLGGNSATCAFSLVCKLSLYLIVISEDKASYSLLLLLGRLHPLQHGTCCCTNAMMSIICIHQHLYTVETAAV